MKKLLTVTFFAAALLALSADPSHAYLNADSGSFIVQGLLGGTAGLFTVCRYIWYSLTTRQHAIVEEQARA
jgi:hypothetical protein